MYDVEEGIRREGREREGGGGGREREEKEGGKMRESCSK